jgi:hypothetical protein
VRSAGTPSSPESSRSGIGLRDGMHLNAGQPRLTVIGGYLMTHPSRLDECVKPPDLTLHPAVGSSIGLS